MLVRMMVSAFHIEKTDKVVEAEAEEEEGEEAEVHQHRTRKLDRNRIEEERLHQGITSRGPNRRTGLYPGPHSLQILPPQPPNNDPTERE